MFLNDQICVIKFHFCCCCCSGSRTFVNLVPSPLINLSFSMDRIQVPWQCHLSRPIECSCLFGPAYSRARTLYRRLERNFVKIMERVSLRAEFHREDFTVVFQPFFKDASVFLGNDKKPDMTIMSVDCIHLSQKGHAIAANGLWNNMLQSQLHKTTGLKHLFQEFKCPSPNEPYLYTYFNSWIEFVSRIVRHLYILCYSEQSRGVKYSTINQNIRAVLWHTRILFLLYVKFGFNGKYLSWIDIYYISIMMCLECVFKQQRIPAIFRYSFLIMWFLLLSSYFPCLYLLT